MVLWFSHSFAVLVSKLVKVDCLLFIQVIACFVVSLTSFVSILSTSVRFVFMYSFSSSCSMSSFVLFFSRFDFMFYQLWYLPFSFYLSQMFFPVPISSHFFHEPFLFCFLNSYILCCLVCVCISPSLWTSSFLQHF